jgi:hypothetical protein
VTRARGSGAPLPLPLAPARPAPLRTQGAGATDTPVEGRRLREDSPDSPAAPPSWWPARPRPSTGPAGRPAPLARLRRELASPAALRRAIVVREILGPPKGLR